MSDEKPEAGSEGIVGQSASTAGFEPLPCPFCGGTDIAIMDGSTFRWVSAACQDCGGSCGEVRVQTTGKPRDEALIEAGQRAIAEWNTRSNVWIAGNPRLVSYAPDGATCTLNFDGEEHYYDRIGTTANGALRGEPLAASPSRKQGSAATGPEKGD